MFKMIRSVLDEGGDVFGGDGKAVEVDETYVGGKRPGKQSAKITGGYAPTVSKCKIALVR